MLKSYQPLKICFWIPRKETTKLLICRPGLGTFHSFFSVLSLIIACFACGFKNDGPPKSKVTYLFKILLSTSLIITLTLSRPHYAPWSCLSCCTLRKEFYPCFAAFVFHSWMYLIKFFNKKGLLELFKLSVSSGYTNATGFKTYLLLRNFHPFAGFS